MKKVTKILMFLLVGFALSVTGSNYHSCKSEFKEDCFSQSKTEVACVVDSYVFEAVAYENPGSYLLTSNELNASVVTISSEKVTVGKPVEQSYRRVRCVSANLYKNSTAKTNEKIHILNKSIRQC